MTDLVNTETGEVTKAVAMPLQDWTPAQIDLMRKQIVPKDINDDEFKVFLHVARHKQLDPFRNQIYAVKRAGRMTIQTGIDGYASLAARTGQFVGMSEPIYKFRGEMLDSCTVTVNRLVGGVVCNFTATAFYDEYFVANNPIWKKMPRTMLAKCSRSLAFRLAFPDELGGIFTSEEMEQAGNPSPLPTPPTTIDAEAEVLPAGEQGQSAPPAKSTASTVEREMPSKYGTTDKPNKCGFCGKFHIVEGDRIVLVDKKWGKEECVVVTPAGEVAEPRATQGQVRTVFAIIGNMRNDKTLTTLPDELYRKCEQWELGSFEKTAANAKWLLDNLDLFKTGKTTKATPSQESMPFDDEPYPIPEEER